MEKKDTSFAAYNSKTPVEEWTIDEVVDYARKFLNFSEKCAKILIEQEINGRRLLRIRNEDAFIKAGLSLGAASDLWAEIEKLKKPLAEPEKNEIMEEMREMRKMFEEMLTRETQPALLLDNSSFSEVWHRAEQISRKKPTVVLEPLNGTVPTISKPFDINSIQFKNENDFVLELANQINSNINPTDQKLYLHVTQNTPFSGFSRRADMVLTSRSTPPTSAAEIVVWIEVKTKDSESEAKGQLISGLTRLHNEAQATREEFYGVIINQAQIKLMKYIMPENKLPDIFWTDGIPWGVPSIHYDEAIQTLLRLINTHADSLGYLHIPYKEQETVPNVHSPVFKSLVLYHVVVHRTSPKRPDIIKVRIERSDLHSTKEKKRPPEGSSEILEGVMKVGKGSCTHEILREREALIRLNPKNGNKNKYTAEREKITFIPELLGYGTLQNNDNLEYNVIAPLGTQLDEILNMARFGRVLEGINQALTTAHNKGIFHCDVSVKNIILTETAAVLIDWGFAFIPGKQKVSRGFTGTPRFASIRITELLDGTAKQGVEYSARDDFEALFYVLLYCTSGKKLPWGKSKSPQELIRRKRIAMTSQWKKTLNCAQPIFHDKLEQMHEILFPNSSYDETLEVKTLLGSLASLGSNCNL
eukprot:TRINITY_DN527_c0_g2_i1.p1 TRINITY_DN527_c0_g2~~TRINITY_DN527_c0_g2_i1.p1  ORF type:complete len:644 (+),score=78.70 TRINITY_DN527_c0_g2_i1:100-2031(+)